MTTAVGTYSTRAAVKVRAGIDSGTTTWDAVIDVCVDAINDFIESPAGCGRIVAPISSATYLIDGNGLTHLYFPKGIRAVTALSIGGSTGATKDTVDPADYFLRPLAQDRTPGFPAFYLYLSDIPSADPFRKKFPKGRENVSLTCTGGFAAIPDNLSEMANTVAEVMFHALEQGNQPMPTLDEQGRPIVARYLSGRDFQILSSYRIHQPQVVG